jgi:hypothetical protein
VQHVRADLIITGMTFSGRVETDISFHDGMLSPQALTENLLANSGRIGLNLLPQRGRLLRVCDDQKNDCAP